MAKIHDVFNGYDAGRSDAERVQLTVRDLRQIRAEHDKLAEQVSRFRSRLSMAQAQLADVVNTIDIALDVEG